MKSEKIKQTILIALTISLWPLIAESSETDRSFLCLAHNVVAFFKTGPEEHQARLQDPEPFKFFIRQMKVGDFSTELRVFKPTTDLGVWLVDIDIPVSRCTEGISESNWLYCDTGQPFIMNTKTLRFLYTDSGNYLFNLAPMRDANGLVLTDNNGRLVYQPIDDDKLAPAFMAIGSCTEL